MKILKKSSIYCIDVVGNIIRKKLSPQHKYFTLKYSLVGQTQGRCAGSFWKVGTILAMSRHTQPSITMQDFQGGQTVLLALLTIGQQLALLTIFL